MSEQLYIWCAVYISKCRQHTPNANLPRTAHPTAPLFIGVNGRPVLRVAQDIQRTGASLGVLHLTPVNIRKTIATLVCSTFVNIHGFDWLGLFRETLSNASCLKYYNKSWIMFSIHWISVQHHNAEGSTYLYTSYEQEHSMYDQF